MAVPFGGNLICCTSRKAIEHNDTTGGEEKKRGEGREKWRKNSFSSHVVLGVCGIGIRIPGQVSVRSGC